MNPLSKYLTKEQVERLQLNFNDPEHEALRKKMQQMALEEETKDSSDQSTQGQSAGNEEQSQSFKIIVEEETKETSFIKLEIDDGVNLQEDFDEEAVSSLAEDETQRAQIGSLPYMNSKSFANLQNVAKSKKASSGFQNYQAVSESYHMRMQLLESGSGVIAFEAKLKDGDLNALANAVVMEVNFLAAQLFELFMYMNELVN